TPSMSEAITTDKNASSDDFDDIDRAGGRRALVDHRVAPTRAGLIVPDLRSSGLRRSVEARRAEFEGLAGAIRLDIVFTEIVRVREVRSATFIGGGQVEALAERIRNEKIELLLVDAALSPIQQRNLERGTGA